MIAEFLRAELNSSRFRTGSLKALKMCGYQEELLINPDCSDPKQNKKRVVVLGLCRGWPDKYLFTNFPGDTKWFSTKLPLDELKKSNRLNSDDKMTNTERSIQITADSVMNGKSVNNIDRTLINQIRKEIEERKQLPPIILVATALKDNKVLLEGHSRSVAYATFQQLDFDIPAIIGISENMADWAYF